MKQKQCLSFGVIVLLSFSLFTVIDSVCAQSDTESPTAAIDLFTNKGGHGHDVDSAAFVPMDLVQLYATVTYGGASLTNHDVVFSVEDAENSLRVVLVSRTNTSGIALAEYRLPASATVGSWSIKASVNVTQVTLSDSTSFTITSIDSNISLNNSNVKVPTTVHKLETLRLNITINNQLDLASWSTLDVTLFDHTQVPIGSFNAKNASKAEPIVVTISIPNTAFVGNATGYICLFDSNGSPLGSETIFTVYILEANTTESGVNDITAFVIPEYVWGALLPLIATFLSFVALTIIKRRRKALISWNTPILSGRCPN